jgi:primosomal protein N' (replication factor Y)
MTEAYARVALPLPLHNGYLYHIPGPLRGSVARGMRAVVPVRGRELIGIVVGLETDPPPVRALDLLVLPDREPLLTEPVLATAEWMAGYYGSPLGLALRAALPAAMWGESKVMMRLLDASLAEGGLAAELVRWLAPRTGGGSVAAASRALGRSTWEAVWRLADRGAIELEVVPPDTGEKRVNERMLVLAEHVPGLLERDTLFRRSPKQRHLLELVEGQGGVTAVRELRERHGVSDAVLRGLVERGLARVDAVERIRDPFANVEGTPPPGTATPDQVAAIAAIEGLAPGTAALLQGVTGSGKTFVYLEAVRRALEMDRGAIVLVPEIALTPQTVSRFRGVFGNAVAVLHSGLSDGERADAWRLLRRGERRVAVGARSAIFAPVRNLGLVVIDEEHETSYKNGEAPRYHAREVAMVRARLEEARVVLGSATPSMESTAMVGSRLTHLRLPLRIGDRPLPPVELVDLRHAPLVREAWPVPWSEALDAALGGALANGEQALLLLNRRGYASFLQCHACAAVAGCPNCSIALTVHRAPEGLRCHYCDHREVMPARCAECGGTVQVGRGVGTQQLERLVAERYPSARIARMDLDTTSGKGAHQRILATVDSGEVDILLGTQMIAKGLDFPRVTLVGVVDADTALHLPDFRAAERTFQLLAQVAGRAGRGPRGGRVIVQTRSPAHHALSFAAAHDTDGFAAAELELRRSPAYPPFVSLVNFVVSSVEELGTADAAAELAAWCAALVARRDLPVSVLGPAPCPLARLKDRWRWHVMLKGPSRAIGQVVRYAARRLPKLGPARVVIDRDPVTLL